MRSRPWFGLPRPLLYWTATSQVLLIFLVKQWHVDMSPLELERFGLTNWQDYLVSGAAGYVSFCQGAPDNVLDGLSLHQFTFHDLSVIFMLVKSFQTVWNLQLFHICSFESWGFPLSHWPSLVARLAIALQLMCACSGVYIPLARAALTHLTKGLDSGAPEGRCHPS